MAEGYWGDDDEMFQYDAMMFEDEQPAEEIEMEDQGEGPEGGRGMEDEHWDGIAQDSNADGTEDGEEEDVESIIHVDNEQEAEQQMEADEPGTGQETSGATVSLGHAVPPHFKGSAFLTHRFPDIRRSTHPTSASILLKQTRGWRAGEYRPDALDLVHYSLTNIPASHRVLAVYLKGSLLCYSTGSRRSIPQCWSATNRTANFSTYTCLLTLMLRI